MSGKLEIRIMQDNDWNSVRDIYLQGIATGVATLETDPGTWEKWDASHLEKPRLVAVFDGNLAGWAALSPVSGRCVYGGVAEVSVYIGGEFRGMGVGLKLLNELVNESKKNKIWTMQAGILSDNRPSIRLHEKAGFRVVGVREKLGRLHGEWKDIVLMERRSTKTGID